MATIEKSERKSSTKKSKPLDLTMKNLDTISKIDDEEEDKPLHPLLPDQKNFRMLVVGPSGCGKTNFLVNYICRFMKVERLYVLSKHLQQDKMEFLHRHFTEIENTINKKLRSKKKPENFKIIMSWVNNISEFPVVDDLDKNYKNVVIFDDIIFEPDKNEKVSNYFVRSRHKNTSVFYLAQSFYAIPRKVRLNTTHYVLYNMPSLTEVSRIHKEVASDLTKNEFIDLFKDAIEDEDTYNFFFIDTLQKKKFLKYRRNLDELLIDPNVKKEKKKFKYESDSESEEEKE
jgi:hypothetical protein